MKHWIIALPREATEHCIKLGTFGRSQKHVLGKVEPGDQLAFYVNGERKITALGIVTEGYEYDEKPIFRSESKGTYPHRFKFEAHKLKKDFDFMTIIDQMSFITNLAYWSVFFRLGFKEIAASDWVKIKKNLEMSGCE